MGLFGDLDIAAAADDPFAVEDGTYITVVTSCKTQTSQKDGKKGLTFDFTIEEEDDNPEKMWGRKISEWLTIPETDENGEFKDPDKGPIFMSFIKRRLKALGVPEDEMNSVEPDDLIGIREITTVKTKNDFQNIVKMVLCSDEESSSGWGV